MVSICWPSMRRGRILGDVSRVPAAGPSAGQLHSGGDVGGDRARSTAAPAAGQTSTVRCSARKRTHAAAARTRAVKVRFADAEFAVITAAASRVDLSPTAYVGVAAVTAARGTEPPGAPVREALAELMQARTAAVRIGGAVNKLAARALAGGDVTAAQLAAATQAAARSVARVEAAAAAVQRRLS